MKYIKKNKTIFLYLFYAIILFGFLFILTGCYDATSIEDYYYAVAIGIDEIENTDNIMFSVQIAQTSSDSESSSSSQSSKYTIYQVEAESIDTGLNILNNYLSKQISLSHCSAIIFSENIARQGIIKYVNTLQNNVEIRPNCDVIISSKKAYDILDKVSNSGENFSSRFFEHIISSAKYTGYTINADFIQFYKDINDSNSNAIAVYATIDNDTIQNTGLAIFSEDTLVDSFDTKNIISHLILINNLKSSDISIPSPFEENATIDLTIEPQKRTKIDINLINNTPFVEINVCIAATISTSNSNDDFTNEENIKHLEKNVSDYVSSILSDYLYTVCKEYSADTIELGNRLENKFKTTDEFDKLDWKKIYKDSFFKVTVNTEINSSKLITKQ